VIVVIATLVIVIGAAVSLKGKSLVFVVNCGPIPKGSVALCIEDCNLKGIIRLWLRNTIYGVNEFVLSREHISKLKEV